MFNFILHKKTIIKLLHKTDVYLLSMFFCVMMCALYAFVQIIIIKYNSVENYDNALMANIILASVIVLIFSVLLIIFLKLTLYDEYVSTYKHVKRLHELELQQEYSRFVDSFFETYVYSKDNLNNVKIYMSEDLFKLFCGHSTRNIIVDPDRHGKDIGLTPKRDIPNTVDEFFEYE